MVQVLHPRQFSYTGSDPRRCEGDYVSSCSFVNGQKPSQTGGCSRCRNIETRILLVQWFFQNCSTEELQRMSSTPHFDWARDIPGFTDYIERFTAWAIEEIDTYRLRALYHDIDILLTHGVPPHNTDEYELLQHRILGVVKETLFDELGGGQKHRQAMAYILGVHFIYPDSYLQAHSPRE